ncbi:MAG TPA: response regulator transcription factor [Prolixibacteraceae bacterium]|jgi:DNA-binding NarL/FixJ family response regulator
MTGIPKILIFFNFSIFSHGIKSLLEKEQFQVVGEASHWEELFQHLKSVTPDVILLDLSHCNDSSIKSLQRLRNDYPQIPVLLCLDEDCTDHIRDLIVMGVMGFVFFDTTFPELINAIDRVASGREYFPDGILKLLKEELQFDRENRSAQYHRGHLTSREMSVCKLICNGLTHKEIGIGLYISPRTVETHKKNILAKLKIKSTAELVKYAIQNHLN